MANIVAMPKLGLTMTEGTIAKWYKNVGDAIQKGDVLFEVATDKLTNEIESDYSGVVLKLCAEEGDSIPCTEPVAYIGVAGEKIEDNAEAAIQDVKVDENVTKVEKTETSIKTKREKGTYVLASPLAKKLAAVKEFDIADIEGTGPNGRVVAKDVENYVAGSNVKMSPTAAKMAKEFGVDVEAMYHGDRLMKADILGSMNSVKAPAAEVQAEKTIKLTPMRKTIASRMSESWTTSPRVTYNRPVDTTAMKDLRSKLNPVLKEQGVKISFNHILMKVCAKVLLEMPTINASLAGDMLTLHPHVNMGLAVGLDTGLLVPNLKNCDTKSLSVIAAETEKLIAAARDGKLSMDDMVGGTFTITNLGAYGISTFSPIINQPELAILGVNAIVETPVVVNGEIVIKPLMNLSLTADHRVIDGLLAAKFLQRVAEYLENPYMLLV